MILNFRGIQMTLKTTKEEMGRFLILNCEGEVLQAVNTQPEADKIGEDNPEVCYVLKITRTKKGLEITDLHDILGDEDED